jgi:hypothetical protein
MQIHALKMSITEQRLNELVTELASGNNPVQNLRLRLTPEGILAVGEYPTMLMRMAFEILWEVKGIGTLVEARLASIKVSGLPAGMLRAVLMKTLRDFLTAEPGVRVAEEAIRVDLSELTALQKLRLGIHLTQVRCEPGNLVIEAGPALV